MSGMTAVQSQCDYTYVLWFQEMSTVLSGHLNKQSKEQAK